MDMTFTVLYRLPSGACKNVIIIASTFEDAKSKAHGMFGDNLISITWTKENNPFYRVE